MIQIPPAGAFPDEKRGCKILEDVSRLAESAGFRVSQLAQHTPIQLHRMAETAGDQNSYQPPEQPVKTGTIYVDGAILVFQKPDPALKVVNLASAPAGRVADLVGAAKAVAQHKLAPRDDTIVGQGDWRYRDGR